MLTALALGLAVGAILGLTGAGGSILAVPMLMAAYGWEVRQAVPVALLAVAIAAALGSYVAWRQGLVRYRAAFAMAATGSLMAPLGVWLSHLAPAALLTGAFAMVLLVAGVRLLRGAAAEELSAGAASDDGPVCGMGEDGRIRWTLRCGAALTTIGASAGLLSGMFGVGGGFVIVPALRRYTPLSMQSAVATSLMVIALVSAAAIASTLAHGQSLALGIAAPFVAGTIGGMVLGRRIAPRIPAARLQAGFAALMLAIAAFMLWQALAPR